ncbi:UDP-N-acetylmuramoyl-L-alanyl-D-glutamate--2,6-diaminopimelate ligase [Spiribacter sp. SSL99]|uniref:UDP-N-acetylmuramoyl-L-alanyl-D-glutamate--2, 6-diaminopimelate ligase n=1 Tax=Spiribacter sp. SSL99 TaxID=1866884 RepID=UPI00132FC435|nr:UDP-N-acetylmuramoyl-L-alanyl-D-glutamate--2,6-diaminopimelate ligase [Spiribacter sp. SSL99]KAF0285302.1 UDP-N-acetylmuramoyl-L-alanyl-D-glutamate--2,6-diaminopimelate ligase [Spiribacter sp. SSL99]
MSRVWSAEALLAPWLVDARLKGVGVTGIALDARQLAPGGLFLALAGNRAHGLDYLDQALAAGAGVVLYEPAAGQDHSAIAARCDAAGAVAIARAGVGALASAIAGRFYDEPSRAMTVIAVTGTDGKTSVSHYIAQMAEDLQGPAAVMGTVGWGRPGQLRASTQTTADPVSIQARLASLRDDGICCVAMEVSSHALAQHRVDGVTFATAVLTHVGRDHLDYHGSAAAYGAAKRRLFAWPGLRRQVLNGEDAVGADLAAHPLSDATPVVYGRTGAADLCLSRLERRAEGLELGIDHADRQHTAQLPLIGDFNALNALAALGALIEPGNVPAALGALGRLQPVPGRMERFTVEGGPVVIVDYAHTAGALAAALDALRPHVRGRLWVVFGCGGDRDTGKRPLMGAAAGQRADGIILTSDNPRSESPAAILEAVRAGCAGHGDCRVIEDRASAITAAIEMAGPGDAVLIAGKGHETEQQIGATAHAFSDRDCAASVLSRRAG